MVEPMTLVLTVILAGAALLIALGVIRRRIARRREHDQVMEALKRTQMDIDRGSERILVMRGTKPV